MGGIPTPFFLDVSGIIIRELTNLGSTEGCGDIVTCHPNAPSMKNLLPQLLGGLWTDNRVDRNGCSCTEPLGPRFCLSWEGHIQGLTHVLV